MSYQQSAPYYDAIYEAMKDYGQEAERLHELIQQRNPGAASLLDVACGTGLHDQYLIQWYRLEGLDISPDQLAIARRRLPKVKFYQDDMTSFRLPGRYDAVTCLFSAIGHLTDLAQMRQGIANMASHLNPGGVLLVEPWLLTQMWKDGHVSVETGEGDGFKVTRACRSWREGRITNLEMRYVIVRPEGFEEFTEPHQTALYTPEEYLDAFRAAGLEAQHLPEGINSNGRGIFIGRLPE